MLGLGELGRWASLFGVAPQQIEKDHLVSHLLAGIATSTVADDVVFFGGTALARTHLDRVRISEDIDLWADSPRQILDVLADELPGRVRREYPGLRFDQAAPSEGSAVARDGTQVRIQVIAYGAEYAACVATERRAIELRYGDLDQSNATLTVPVRSSFVAMKHLAWAERAAPRDLVDLVALAEGGAFDRDADATVRCIRGFGVRRDEFQSIPQRTRRAWQADLARQMGQPPDPGRALSTVRSEWGRSLGWSMGVEL